MNSSIPSGHAEQAAVVEPEVAPGFDGLGRLAPVAASCPGVISSIHQLADLADRHLPVEVVDDAHRQPLDGRPTRPGIVSPAREPTTSRHSVIP
jgi:hypothetical protein